MTISIALITTNTGVYDNGSPQMFFVLALRVLHMNKYAVMFIQAAIFSADLGSAGISVSS